MKRQRGYIQLIIELDEVKGGKGGDLTDFLAYVETITPAEAKMLSSYADTLKKFAESILKNQIPIKNKQDLN